jgi:hypothetical protein
MGVTLVYMMKLKKKDEYRNLKKKSWFVFRKKNTGLTAQDF